MRIEPGDLVRITEGHYAGTVGFVVWRHDWSGEAASLHIAFARRNAFRYYRPAEVELLYRPSIAFEPGAEAGE